MTLTPIGIEEIGLIQGIKPDSVEEWRTATALYTFRWDFEFQVPVGGGHRRKGGSVVDFLVKTLPAPTALFVDGAYWHSGEQKAQDVLSRINLKKIFGAVYGLEPRVVELFASDLYDQEATNSAILRTIGRN